MALSDTAEYWWDVKSSRVYNGPKFIHLKGMECGHYHVAESNKLIDVDCHACIKKINETPELKQRLEQSIKSREDHKFRFGKCECGCAMTIRKNRRTNQEFLGCINYPNCKRTRAVAKKI